MANDSEQVEGGRPVAITATTNGNGSQEPSPILQVTSNIPSIKITKVCYVFVIIPYLCGDVTSRYSPLSGNSEKLWCWNWSSGKKKRWPKLVTESRIHRCEKYCKLRRRMNSSSSIDQIPSLITYSFMEFWFAFTGHLQKKINQFVWIV